MNHLDPTTVLACISSDLIVLSGSLIFKKKCYIFSFIMGILENLEGIHSMFGKPFSSVISNLLTGIGKKG